MRYLQALQVMVALELVEGLGVSSVRTAELLGLAPSAVSQYLSGKRRGGAFLPFAREEEARRVARSIATRLSSIPVPRTEERMRLLLEGARSLVEQEEGGEIASGAVGRLGAIPRAEHIREMIQWTRARVRAEQRAVTQSMRLAQKARDELTRAVFRQIASDSLRHAEIVASLGPYLTRGVTGTRASGISRQDVEALIRSERRAETGPEPALARKLEGTLALLIESIEADERKHDALLSGLLETGWGASSPDAPAKEAHPRGRRTRTPPPRERRM
ncbi:MAG: hypothetical protein L3K07_03760 [Thermoplasmata archaeon]|nr:hypothetical protein [Thermoplasmata archaeon]